MKLKNSLHQEAKGYPYTLFYNPKQNTGTTNHVNICLLDDYRHLTVCKGIENNYLNFRDPQAKGYIVF